MSHPDQNVAKLIECTKKLLRHINGAEVLSDTEEFKLHEETYALVRVLEEHDIDNDIKCGI